VVKYWAPTIVFAVYNMCIVQYRPQSVDSHKATQTAWLIPKTSRHGHTIHYRQGEGAKLPVTSSGAGIVQVGLNVL